jgi:hypothetical protein
MEIYDDIDLCYKVMGLTFSDPPDRVDRVYNGLITDYTKDIQSTDTTLRNEAKKNLEQTKDLYERITNSMIYKDYAREYEKYKQLKADEMDARKRKQEAEKDKMVSCPYCRKLIMPNLKVCMYCHCKILSPMEMMMVKVFSTRNMILMAVAFVLIIAAVVFVMYPQLLK